MAVRDAAGLWEVFAAKAEALGASVKRAPSGEAAAGLVRSAAPEYVCTRSCAARFPAIAATALTSSDHHDEVVTTAQFAIAETGSVGIDEPPDDRGRCFLAERLWVLVSEGDLVPTLDTGLQRIGDLLRRGAGHPLLMSGPSRTADIERVLTIGVHGPRALVIVVVEGS